ncbi:MAG: GDP-mannose 4,6-dehydratase [Thermoleophilia bacterium]
MHILTTGSKGFVGRHIAAEAEARGYECIGLDHTRAVAATNASPTPGAMASRNADRTRVFYTADITDAAAVNAVLAQVIEDNGPPEYVFHMAAQASVAASFDSPAATYAANVVGTAVVLDALAELSPESKVLVPSSAHVYGPPPDAEGLLAENSPLVPETHYGVSKVAQEMIGRLYHERRGLPVYLTRAFNHCGPGQGAGFVFSDFARRLALLERAGGGALHVGNLEAARDFLDVRDVVDAYFAVLESGTPALPYNVASGAPVRIGAILEAFLEELTVEVVVRPDPALFRPVDVPVLAGDASRLRGLGWQPAHRLQDTIRETLDYWRAHIAREEESTP